LANGLDPRTPGGLNGPSGDPDADGANNLQEYLAGTNPQDGGHVLKLLVSVSPPYCVLNFNTTTGRIYTVEAATGLGATNVWSTVTGGLSGTGSPAAVNDLLGSGARFYRLRVTPN
jgi:hypothetical protein